MNYEGEFVGMDGALTMPTPMQWSAPPRVGESQNPQMKFVLRNEIEDNNTNQTAYNPPASSLGLPEPQG
jgi:hypothetical protein